MAVADTLELAAEVAVTVTVCAAEIIDGAVYTPEEDSVPTAGDIDQETDVLALPVTLALKD